MDSNERDSNQGGTDRRHVLKLLGALGVTGLAGCGGDDTDTDGGNGNGNGNGTTTGGNGNGNGMGTTTGGNGNGNGTGTTAGDTDTSTGTEPADTDTSTGTEPEDTDTPTETEPEDTDTETDSGQDLGDDPAQLLQIEGGSVQAGETTTLSGALENPYLFDVQNVEVTMNAPNDDWTVSPTGDTSFDSIESGGSQDVGWEVTAPEDADGEFTMEGSVVYESNTDSADLPVSVSVVIFTPGEAPQEGLEAYFPLNSDTPVNQLTGNEATVVGEPSSGATGVLENAWEFTTDGDMDTVADTIISEPLPINGEEVTVAAWINHGAIVEEYSRVYHVDEAGNAAGTSTDNPPTNGWNVEFGGTANTLAHQYWVDGDTAAESQPAVPCPQDTWIFVVTVLEGSDATIYTFDQSGQLDGSPGTGGGERPTTDDASLILMVGDGRDTPGRMDEVRAYSRALSEDEVERLYQASGGSSS